MRRAARFCKCVYKNIAVLLLQHTFPLPYMTKVSVFELQDRITLLCLYLKVQQHCDVPPPSWQAVSIMGEEVFSFKLSLFQGATEGDGSMDEPNQRVEYKGFSEQKKCWMLIYS